MFRRARRDVPPSPPGCSAEPTELFRRARRAVPPSRCTVPPSRCTVAQECSAAALKVKSPYRREGGRGGAVCGQNRN